MGLVMVVNTCRERQLQGEDESNHARLLEINVRPPVSRNTYIGPKS